MASGPSVGDILMLSQLAWKIGRAFTQGRKDPLSEFTEVEREANGLSEALKLVAETLYSDTSILAQADEQTRHAVSTILDSAHKTLGDLESFVERYRVIRKKETRGGFVVERTWSEVVIAQYKTLKWTTEGGDITDLRDMLHMHTTSIDLTMQALQSQSLSRLGRTVIPMAENVASIHDVAHGDISARIDDLHRSIMSVANSTPSLQAADDHDECGRHSSISESTASNATSASPISTRSRLSDRSTSEGAPRIPVRHPARPSSPPDHRVREDSAYFSMGTASRDFESKRMDWRFESGSPPDDRTSIGVSMSAPPSGSTAVATPGSYIHVAENEEQYVLRRESLTVPHMFSTFDDDADAHEPNKFRNQYYSQRQNLPPPALPRHDEEVEPSPATPSSFFLASRPKRTESNLSVTAGASPRPSTARSVRKRHSFSAEVSPAISDVGQKFEKSLFRNAAILCDVRGTLVEYAQHVPDEPDPRYDTEMVEACKECRIFVIRKRENRPHGGFKVVSAIWAISNDGAVRMQQRLPEFAETVPYCSYFQPEKVSLPPTYGDMTLRFHPEGWDDDVEKEAKSNWVNYVFASEEGANQFQSAIFGRTLLGSFRTTKTTVIHEGFKGAFAFEEQFANIEVLRLWEDDGITTAGASGGVLALMHLGSNFGQGWARWWMNSSNQHVRVKDEQTKFARIKGIDIRTVKPGERARQASFSEDGVSKKKSPEKRVTGVRIEFKNEVERARFVELVKRVQERLLPLPDV